MGLWIKHGALAATCAVALLAPAAAATAANAKGEIAQQAGFRFWDLKDSDEKGWQMVAPLDLTYTFSLDSKSQLDLSARSAYIISENNSAGAKGRVSTFSDTVVGATVSVSRYDDWQPFITLDMNLPTGKDKLKGSDKNAIMDPDLVDLVRFGEGFNFNLSVGLTYLVPETNWSVTGAVGYNWRGAYTPDGDTGDEFNPGDQLTGLVRVQYLSEKIYGAVSVQYFDEDISSLAHVDYFNPGNQWEINAEGTYVIDDKQSVSASIYFATSARNEYYDFFTNELVKEEAVGNGDYYFGQLAYSRILTESVGASLGVVYGERTKNDYIADSDFFVPARTYWGVNASLDYTAPGGWVVSANAGLGQVKDDPTAYAPESLKYDTYNFGLAVSYAL